MADMMRNCRGGFSPRASAASLNENGNGNGNEGRMQGVNCQRLKKKLQAIDFAIVDTNLYLDAYPNCRQALDYYHKLIAEREALVSVINEKCGPVSARENKSRTEWNWIRGPWPWELDANS